MTGHHWSEADIALLRKLYPVTRTTAIAIQLNRTVASVYGRAYIEGFSKSRDYLASDQSGRLRKGLSHPGSEATQFQKGQIPANKGLRRPGWAPGRMKETQFRKGCRSGIAARNWKPIGTILADSEGYLRIKVRESVHGKEATGFGNTKVWPLYARHVWAEHHGPIPAGHVIRFKDKDRSNCEIDNLELLSQAENGRRNSMWTIYPRELAEVIQLGGVLKRKLRQANGEK